MCASQVTSQLHPGQPTSCEAAEEAQPTSTILGGGDVDAEDLPVPVGVDAGGDQHMHRHHPAALTDLHRQRVGGHERVRAHIQRPGAKRLHVLIQLLGHHADLRLAQPSDAQGLHQLLHPPSADAEQVAGGHHRAHRSLGAPAAFQQPLGEVGAGAQLGQRQLDRAHPGVPVPGTVAVAGVGPLGAAGAIGSATHRVRIRAHQRLHEHLQQRTQQIGLGTLQVLADHLGKVNTVVVGGHRADLLSRTLVGLLRITR